MEIPDGDFPRACQELSGVPAGFDGLIRTTAPPDFRAGVAKAAAVGVCRARNIWKAQGFLRPHLPNQQLACRPDRDAQANPP
jgi:hypothetical protein